MASVPRILFLTGAPDPVSLDLDEKHLTAKLLPAFTDEKVPDFVTKATEPRSDESQMLGATWRSLPLRAQHLRTGYSQPTGVAPYGHPLQYGTDHDSSVSFLNSSYISSGTETSDSKTVSQEEEQLSQFYEHSFAVHEDIASSLVQDENASEEQWHGKRPHSQMKGADSSFASSILSTQDNTLSSFGDETSQLSPLKAPPPILRSIKDIREIPGPNYLNSIVPQTMTVNLVVGIISIAQPRTITTRRGRSMEIVETIVGDETRTGFGINFWLIGGRRTRQSKNEPLRESLANLRPQDVILLRNVALSSYQGKVYGQSLRNSLTKVYLAFRERLDKSDAKGCYVQSDLDEIEHIDAQAEKVKRVREWVHQFVVPPRIDVKAKVKKRRWHEREDMPPDTQ
ncbi:MAG: hypothetical protein M1824_006018 [Vezdaea acicularis]|nr:MAG: hypothetical protein M1824_006018 [Vezdaea acicularis]